MAFRKLRVRSASGLPQGADAQISLEKQQKRPGKQLRFSGFFGIIMSMQSKRQNRRRGNHVSSQAGVVSTSFACGA